jgi:hypothetical protein
LSNTIPNPISELIRPPSPGSFFSVAVPPACALHVGVSRAAGTAIGNPDLYLSANVHFAAASHRNMLQCPSTLAFCTHATQARWSLR